MSTKKTTLSVVVPVYNEAPGISQFNASLTKVLTKLRVSYEIIYVNDGSTDASKAILKSLANKNKNIRVLNLSRNFGKEIATTAGIHHAQGEATLMIDADGQHPVQKIGEFLDAWRGGAKVVVGVREQNSGEGFVKRYGSKLFYRFFNRFAGTKLRPASTDFRLIDQDVREIFSGLTEHNRITRGLIDWIGFERAYVPFVARPRTRGESGYSFGKLCKLAVDSIISLSNLPLYIAAYVGAFIIAVSGAIGTTMLVNLVMQDPLSLNAHPSAYGLVLILLLVGVILVFQGILGIYMSHIHTETQNRPLYIVEKDKPKR